MTTFLRPRTFRVVTESESSVCWLDTGLCQRNGPATMGTASVLIGGTGHSGWGDRSTIRPFGHEESAQSPTSLRATAFPPLVVASLPRCPIHGWTEKWTCSSVTVVRQSLATSVAGGLG